MACININNQTKYVSIEIINDSYCKLDQVSIQLNNYSRSILNVEKGDTILLNIDKDSVKTYSEVFLTCWVYFKTSNPLNLAKYQMYYDDLGGSLDEKYTITLKKDTTISIIPSSYVAPNKSIK